MELCKILVLTCYIFIVLDLLGVGADISKKTSFRMCSTYLELVGLFNALVGLIVCALFTFYFSEQTISDTFIHIGVFGSWLQCMIGIAMVIHGELKFDDEE